MKIFGFNLIEFSYISKHICKLWQKFEKNK